MGKDIWEIGREFWSAYRSPQVPKLSHHLLTTSLRNGTACWKWETSEAHSNYLLIGP